MTADAAIIFAGLLAVAALVGLAYTIVSLNAAITRIYRLEAKLLPPEERPYVPLEGPQRDEYAPDAEFDDAGYADYTKHFDVPWPRADEP